MKQSHFVDVESLQIRFSTGDLAKLASGSVTVSLGNTNLLVTATAAKNLRPDQNFFPLTVDYKEKFSAAGRFPGGYLKREGRPSDKEVLTSRLCDRPLRPLFPKGFMNEVQVIGMLLSADLVHEPDVLMVNGASAALMVSDIPWKGPIGCVRIGQIDGEFVVNPNNEQMLNSSLNLIYAGNETEMMMIEGNADQISEENFCKALEFAQGAIQPIIQAQKELAEKVKKAKQAFPLVSVDKEVLEFCQQDAAQKLEPLLFIEEKQERQRALDQYKAELKEALEAAQGENAAAQLEAAFDHIQKDYYRNAILSQQKRPDGRRLDELRPLELDANMLPCVHGSAVFQRGQTQALATTTLGSGRDTQELDGLTGGARSKTFILHYNFPPFSVGECGRFGFTSRREVGHGNLAEGSLLPVIPQEDDFPYVIRVTSEVLESNGSSSMASVCAGCLSLMDAGVPIIAPVAGISMGLVTKMDDDASQIQDYQLLTDILGAEDHFGDMDFKIAGTREGITGFQLDLKIKGLPFDIAKKAIFESAKVRSQILDKMAQVIEAPRKELNASAPRIHAMQIDPEKIGLLIGPGGKNIRRITEVSGADIDINEDNSGAIKVFATSKEAMDRAIEEIEMITAEIEPGRIYRGVVRGVKEFGAFVECLPGKEGLVHISELAQFRVRRTEDVCKEGDEMIVKCLGVDEKGRVRLSRKAVIEDGSLEEADKTASTV